MSQPSQPLPPTSQPWSPPAIAYIGLGANLGNCLATLHTALHSLAAWKHILACEVSPFYRTAPVATVGPDFVNAVARLETSLDPWSLLDVLQALERQHGRERPFRYAPRTLDLDLLLYNNLQLHSERLTLPHPRMHQRAFVLRPLQDLDAQMQWAGQPLQTWLDRCSTQPIERLTS